MNLCRQVANIITTDQIVRHADCVIKSTETDDYAACVKYPHLSIIDIVNANKKKKKSLKLRLFVLK